MKFLDAPCRNCIVYIIQLESATPYVFVDSLAVQTPSTTGQRGAQDPKLRLTLSLRALWRRGSA